MTGFAVPGVRREFFAALPAPAFRTGVPAFLGLAARGTPGDARAVAAWAEFEALFGGRVPGGYLAPAVHGFFRAGGTLCRVVRLEDASPGALGRALLALEGAEDVDLVCAPDVLAGGDARAGVRMQQMLLAHCAAGVGRFAILDALPGADVDGVRAQRAALGVVDDAPRGEWLKDGALYHPWLVVEGWTGPVPPCGYVAGVYALADRRAGPHRAPANERLDGVLDLHPPVDEAAQARLNPVGINAIRAFPGRGVRVWGARTLAGQDPADGGTPDPWTYVSVRRTYRTLERWLDRTLSALAFEAHDAALWARVTREVGAHLAELYRRGALAGATPEEAFYVRCDAELNPPEVRAAGALVAEVGIAPALPNEFLVVRFARRADGAETLGPAGPA